MKNKHLFQVICPLIIPFYQLMIIQQNTLILITEYPYQLYFKASNKTLTDGNNLQVSTFYKFSCFLISAIYKRIF